MTAFCQYQLEVHNSQIINPSIYLFFNSSIYIILPSQLVSPSLPSFIKMSDCFFEGPNTSFSEFCELQSLQDLISNTQNHPSPSPSVTNTSSSSSFTKYSLVGEEMMKMIKPTPMEKKRKSRKASSISQSKVTFTILMEKFIFLLCLQLLTSFPRKFNSFYYILHYQ